MPFRHLPSWHGRGQKVGHTLGGINEKTRRQGQTFFYFCNRQSGDYKLPSPPTLEAPGTVLGVAFGAEGPSWGKGSCVYPCITILPSGRRCPKRSGKEKEGLRIPRERKLGMPRC